MYCLFISILYIFKMLQYSSIVMNVTNIVLKYEEEVLPFELNV